MTTDPEPMPAPVPVAELKAVGDEPPRPVLDAAVLMRAGAGLSVVRALYAFAITHPTRRDEVAGRLAVGVVFQVSLWLWMARRSEVGWRWARPVSLVLAAANVIVAVVQAILGDYVVLAALAALSAVVGVVIVGLLHRPAAAEHFRKG